VHGLEALFGTTSHVTAAQECARAFLVFAYGLALVRLAGRRVFGRWSAIDIVVSIVVGSNLSRALTGNAPLAGTLAARSRAVSRLVEGRPIELGRGGRLTRRKDLRTAISEADLAEALRQAGIERVEESRILMLEPSGRISVLK